MENLKLRMTLTDGKGWKDTKIIQLSHYLLEKENGKNLLDETLENLLDDQKNIKNNRVENKQVLIYYLGTYFFEFFI
jgi:mannosyltransferase OCH1-like enzyme